MPKRSKRAAAVVLIINALLLAAFGMALTRFYAYGSLLAAQNAAVRWRGGSETRFAQISCFRPVGGELSMSEIEQFRGSVDSALVAASIDTSELNMWVDAFCAKTTVSAQGSKGTMQVTTFAIGGDYFVFHPLKLISGSYIRESDFTRDCVVVSRELAWGLFGAVDVAGMSITIGGLPYLITGVVDMESDAASEAAGSTGQYLFMHYDSVFAYGDDAINVYEIILADPISDFAYGVVRDNFQSGGEIIENSRRFTLQKISDLILNFGKRSMNNSGILYPYWENAARYAEDRAALTLTLAAVFALAPAASAGIVVWRTGKQLKIKGKHAANRIRMRQ